jgi:hypothetical protein
VGRPAVVRNNEGMGDAHRQEIGKMGISEFRSLKVGFSK